MKLKSVLFDIGENINEKNITFNYIENILGSGFEKSILSLAKNEILPNMLNNSAIVAEKNFELIGFFIFMQDHKKQEFRLLQWVLDDRYFSLNLYRSMLTAVLAENKKDYPEFVTVREASEFVFVDLFEQLNFNVYFQKNGVFYMTRSKKIMGNVRLKMLAQLAQTNVWNSMSAQWLKTKSELNDRIESSGAKYGVSNPKFATREGCWQGEKGLADYLTGKPHNGNASVLDPLVCEICARLFMPREGWRVYNPFGGGVQMGYICGLCEYEYIASEIRQNQCDANNKICADFNNIKWICADSGSYNPEGMFDLIFTCPPYYKVEKYVDYDGKSPVGEINSLSTYEEFRQVLFSGFKKAIEHLNNDRFFIAMVGDSRDKNGAYYGMEAETELFLKQQGLRLYNKVVFIESAFTRIVQAKSTINSRKLPKQEQKIIIAYKGDLSKIKTIFTQI